MLSTTSRKAVCLLMLVKNEAKIIERCLSSARHLIDYWIIIDTGSKDTTQSIAEHCLAGIPGQLLEREWKDFATHRNELLNLAQGHGDYGLFLDADETLHTELVDPWRTCENKIHQLEIRGSEFCSIQPRLIALSTNAHFERPVAEKLNGSQGDYFSGAHIVHHEDGERWSAPDTTDRDIALLQSAENALANDNGLLFEIGIRLLSIRKYELAIEHFTRFLASNSDQGYEWLARYQRAKALERSGGNLDDVIEAYAEAYEQRPDKIEPLLRIAKICFDQHNYPVAADLAWTAIGTEFCGTELYFEADAYEERRHLIYLQAKLAMGKFAEVIVHTEKCLAHPGRQAGFIQQASNLRDKARLGVNPYQEQAAQTEVITKERTELRPIQAATPPHKKCKLCIGMATYDDYDGVYFSVAALRLYHPEILDDSEIVVIDNNPSGSCGEALKALDGWFPKYRYVPEPDLKGTAVRDLIFREANADYVLVIDSHVMFEAGSLKRLLDYFEANPNQHELLQGPLLYDDMKNIATHFSASWNNGMFGKWDTDSRGLDTNGEPFDIPMQGLGSFACRKDHWPGFNKRFRGFGGEEGYIHEKFRQMGGRTLCLPFLRWMHRFQRPTGSPYEIKWRDRIRNYMIGHHELGQGFDHIQEHFNELIGEPPTTSVMQDVQREIDSPLFVFDAVYLWQGEDLESAQIKFQLENLGISDSVICICAKPPADQTIATRMAMHRASLMLAQRTLCKSVLVIDNLSGLNETLEHFDAADEQQLRSLQWSVYSFGDSKPYCATGYHHRVYEQLLDTIPDDLDSAEQWQQAHGGYDQLLSQITFT